MVSFLATLLAVAPVALAATIVDDSQCDCYLTNGTHPTYYKSHMFWDFRSLKQYLGTPDVITTVKGNKDAGFSSTYFDWNSKFGQTWGIQNWDNGDTKLPMVNSKSNVYIEKNKDAKPQSDTFMSMRTARLPKFQTAAEIESINSYKFASMRYFTRTIGHDGACTAMFTYRGGKKLADVQEADIEFLTRERRNIVHYTNQPSYTDEGGEVKGATIAGTMPNGKDWTTWAAHRMDWTPGKTVWSVNGKQTAAISFQTPRDPAKLTFNAWSNGKDWTGKMVNGGAAWQQIQWIEILHGLASKSTCSRVCSIDKSPKIGKAVRL